MIHNIFIDSLQDLKTLELDNPTDGDLLFATLFRADAFSHLTCGIFRLKDNFDTSGETQDDIFVIPSAIHANWYWKRVYKGVPKVYASGITTVAGSGGTVIVDHPAEPANSRLFEVIVYNVDSHSTFLNVLSAPQVYALGPNLKVYPMDTHSNYPEVSLARTYSLVKDYDVVRSVDPLHYFAKLHKDGKLYVYGNKEGDFIYTDVYAESGGTWSRVDVQFGQATSTVFMCPAVFRSVKDDLGLSYYYNNTYGCVTVRICRKSGNTWTIDKYLSAIDNEGNSGYATGLLGFTLVNGDDIWTSEDYPPSHNWGVWYANAERAGVWKATNYNLPTYAESWPTNNHAGVSYELLWAPNSVLVKTFWAQQYKENYKVWVSEVGWDLGVFDSYYELQDHGDLDITVYFGVDTFHYIYTVSGDAAFQWHFDVDGSGKLINPTSQALSSTTITGIGYNGTQPSLVTCNDEHILDNGYRFDPYTLKFFGTNGNYGNVCSFRDLLDPDGIRVNAVSGNDYGLITHLPGNKVFYNDGGDYGVACIAHLEVTDDYDSVYLVFNDKLDSPTGLTSVTVVASEPAGSSIYLLIQGADGNKYKWNGTNWVVETDFLLGNTITEWNTTANWPQVLTDLGTLSGLDFIVVMVSDAGTVSPTFTSIDVSYTRGTDYTLDMGYVHGDGNDIEATFLSDTQTSFKNLNASSKVLEAKVFIMD